MGFKPFTSVKRESESPLKQQSERKRMEIFNSIQKQNSIDNAKEDAKMNQAQKMSQDSRNHENIFFNLKKTLLNKENLNNNSNSENTNNLNVA